MKEKNKIEEHKTKRVIGLDLVRFIAIFFLISVHFMIYSHFYTSKMEGIGMFVMTGMRWLFFICVPLFILLTGYLKTEKKPNKTYYKSIVPILVSYVILSLIAILVKKFLFHDPTSIGIFLMGIFNFTTLDYAWYLAMYIGLFLLIPFLNILYKNIDTKRNKQILLISLIFLVGIPPMINQLTVGTVKLDVLPEWWLGIYPLLYYFIGCYIKEYQIKIPKAINGILILFVLFLETVMSFFYSQGKIMDGNFMGGYNALPTIILATLVFLLLYNINLKNRSLRIIIMDVSKLSFDIYLISCLVDHYFYTKFANLVTSCPKALLYYFAFVPVIFITSYILVFMKRCIIDGLLKLKNSIEK